MSNEIKNKTRPVLAVTSAGTALGTSSIIDTSGWEYAQLMNIHGGTGGSRTIHVYANVGTQMGTSAATMPDLVWIGSGNSDFAGLGKAAWVCGSLTDQAIVAYGTSTDLSWSLSYKFFE